MLGAQGILPQQDVDSILAGLDQVEERFRNGEVQWDLSLEDIHMHVEKLLTEIVGDAGKRLHTARSRNDQVATGYRMFLRRCAGEELRAELIALQKDIVGLASRHGETLMPGMTHLQPAQPIVLGHHLMAWYEMLRRDRMRLDDWAKRMNTCPLGAAALAGTRHPIDVAATARDLGFDEPLRNSLDAVSDRDFAVELASLLAVLMMHLSRFAEEVVLWVSTQYGWAKLDDSICAGSSIMPQKRNPDVAELVRGRTGRVYGSLMGLLTMLKAQPLAYNKDMQEDKEGLMDALSTTMNSVRAWRLVARGLDFNVAKMADAAGQGHSTATDLADLLVADGVPFRDAHDIVGRAVRRADELNTTLAELPDNECRSIDSRLRPEILRQITLRGCVEARQHPGGTAPARVAEAAREALQELNSLQSDAD